MAGQSAIQRDKSMLHKWLGPNRSTHWTVAGSVAVIVVGGYGSRAACADHMPAPITSEK